MAESDVLVTNGGAAVPAVGALGAELGVDEVRKPSWFTRLVGAYLRRYHQRKPGASDPVVRRGTESDAAHAAIRRACVKSSLTGALAGSISTGATVVTAETRGIGGVVAVPIAAATIGGEMLVRAIVHLELTCELAEIFDVKFDADDTSDLWRLYAVAFGTHGHDDDSDDPGKELVHKVAHVEAEDVGEKIGSKLLGESVMRNVVPFVGIASSSITNWMVTRRLGDTVRRYMRYQRALSDAIAQAESACQAHIDLLIEGIWFIFIADGKLVPEEAAILAGLLERVDPTLRAAIRERFVEDELEWTERIRAVPEGTRDAFLHALNVAAAVDKSISLPERKILRRAARVLGRELDLVALDAMMKEFEEVGVLRQAVAGSAST